MNTCKLDFVGVGTGKSGTTWIAQCLDEHPQVCIAQMKEANFFCTKHILENLPVAGSHYTSCQRDKGIKWLQSQFAHLESDQLLGEFSPTYFSDPSSPTLLREHNSTLKLIFNFRNPSDAIYAGFFQIYQTQPIHIGFEEFIEKYPEFVEYYRLHTNMQRFLKIFPHQQTFCILVDDMKADTNQVYRDTCRFLEIDEDFIPETLHTRVNQRRVVRSLALRDVAGAITHALNQNTATKLIKKMLVKMGFASLQAYLHQINTTSSQAAKPMTPETRAKLVKIFRDENLRLGDLISRDLSHWNV